VKIFAVELYHYREWTETLGYDREWKIQMAQSKLSFFVNRFSSRINAFPLMTRMDRFLLIADGVDNRGLEFLFSRLKDISDTPLRGCLSFGTSLLEAERRASLCVRGLEQGEISVNDYPDSEVVAVHADVDSFTEFTERSSTYTSFRKSMEVMIGLQRVAEEMGGLVQYLGGDNFMIFTSREGLKGLLESSPEGVKMGVGICENPRCAVARSTEALTRIRETRDTRWRIVEGQKS